MEDLEVVTQLSVLCELLKDQHCIRVIYSREYEKGNPSFIADRVYELYQKYNNLWIWIDGSNRAFVNELKVPIWRRSELRKSLKMCQWIVIE